MHDSPKEAAQAEVESAQSTKFDDGAPGQTSEAETDHEQKEKPHAEPKKGTLQDDQDTESRPTDLGKARQQTTKVRLFSFDSRRTLVTDKVNCINLRGCVGNCT
jgi:hypothetical protein